MSNNISLLLYDKISQKDGHLTIKVLNSIFVQVCLISFHFITVSDYGRFICVTFVYLTLFLLHIEGFSTISRYTILVIMVDLFVLPLYI